MTMVAELYRQVGEEENDSGLDVPWNTGTLSIVWRLAALFSDSALGEVFSAGCVATAMSHDIPTLLPGQSVPALLWTLDLQCVAGEAMADARAYSIDLG
jgi:hypothetical protein